jgi:putative hydrolase of the HAD superfamily
MRRLFDRQFLSYELGLAKPDREIFERVVDDLDVSAEEILFLDDNQINVDGARSVGMRAELTRGLASARRAIEALGLV